MIWGPIGAIRERFGSHLGVTSGQLRDNCGYFSACEGDLKPLWDDLEPFRNHFGNIKVRFRKTLIFPIDFNDFIKYSGCFEITFW